MCEQIILLCKSKDHFSKLKMDKIFLFLRTASIIHINPELFIEEIAGNMMVVFIGNSKRRLYDRKIKHFKALSNNDDTSAAIADHVKTTGHNIKWDHFDILAKGKTDYHCKVKNTSFIHKLEPAFNVNVGSEKLRLY